MAHEQRAAKANAVTSQEPAQPPTQTFDAVCEGGPVPGGFCKGWASTRWPTQEAADARLAEHMHEHETGEPTPELSSSTATEMINNA